MRIGIVAALVLGLSVATALAGFPSPREAGASAAQVEPPLQPVVTEPAPDPRHRLPFGTLRVSPTTLVAGAPDQDLTVTINPDRAPDADEVLVRIYRPSQPDSRANGSGITRVELVSRTLGLDGRSASSFTLSDLSPPAGHYRVDVLDPGAGRAPELIERAAVAVYAQHRLPPGIDPGGTGEDGKKGGGGKDAGEAGGARALVNPRVNHNVTDDTEQQAETFVAAEPDNSARVIAAVNPDLTNPQAWVSNDSLKPGTTTERTLPSSTLMPTAEGGGTQTLSLCCDPALTADDRGNLWYSVLTLGASSHIIINRMAGPSGTTFQANNTAIPRATTGTQDKNMITVDSWASSPKRYRLYAVWTENPGQNIVISACDATTASNCDNPDNWSVPVDVTASAGNYIYATVAAAPNGDVYVAWWNYAADDIEIDRCLAAEDCATAAAWNEETDIDTDLDPGSASALPFFCPIIAAPGGRVGALTYVDVGPDGRVYVAWSELRNNNTGRCQALGTDRTFDSYVAAGSSANAFPATNSGVRLSDDSVSALNDHFFASLAADPTVPGRVETSLYSTKHDPTGQETHQYYVASTNNGASFGPMERITTVSSDFSGPNSDGFDYGDYEGGDAGAGVYYPVWTDNRDGDAELFALTPPSNTRPANDDFAGAETLAGSSAAATGTNVSASFEAGEPDHAGGFSGGQSVWYAWQAPDTGTATINTCGAGTNYDTTLAAYTGSTVNALTEVASNDDSSACGAGSVKSEISFATVAGTTYRIAVDGFEGDAGNISLALSSAAAPPPPPPPPPSDGGAGGDTTPPDTTITKKPKDKTKKKTAIFEFTSTEPGSTFECSFDGGPFQPCTSPETEKVGKGKHTFQVRARDAAGNTDGSPATDSWKVKKKKKK